MVTNQIRFFLVWGTFFFFLTSVSSWGSLYYYGGPEISVSCDQILAAEKSTVLLAEFRDSVLKGRHENAVRALQQLRVETGHLASFALTQDLLWALPHVILSFRETATAHLEKLIRTALSHQEQLWLALVNDELHVPDLIQDGSHPWLDKAFHLLEEIAIRTSFRLSTRNTNALLASLKEAKPDSWVKNLHALDLQVENYGIVPVRREEVADAYAGFSAYHGTPVELLSAAQIKRPDASWKKLESDLNSDDWEANRRARFFLTQYFYVLDDAVYTVAQAQPAKSDLAQALRTQFLQGLTQERNLKKANDPLEHVELHFAEPLSRFERTVMNKFSRAMLEGEISGMARLLNRVFIHFPWLVRDPADGEAMPTSLQLAVFHRHKEFIELINQVNMSPIARALWLGVRIRSWLPGFTRLVTNYEELARNIRDPFGRSLMDVALRLENYEAVAVLHKAGIKPTETRRRMLRD